MWTCENKGKGSRGRCDTKRNDPARTVRKQPSLSWHYAAPVTSPMLYLCDNQALLKAVKRWVGEGRKATSVCRHFVGSNRRASKKNNSRSSDVSGQGESASRRTCKWRNWHPSRQGYFRQRCSHEMARQDKSSSLHMAHQKHTLVTQ